MDDMDHDLRAGPPPIPITILTGFLGAGKTTRLNRILTGDHGLRVAVLVNDFGSITVDADLVVGVKGNVISLANGRICCTIRDDLIDTVMATIARPEQPECIVLEASGVAEPSGIAVTFITESGFVASEFGDRILAFQHAWGSKGSSVGIEANTHLERKTNHAIWVKRRTHPE